MDIQYLRTYCKEKIRQNPGLQDEIVELYNLAMSEIEEGGSERKEVDSAISSIDELINGWEEEDE
jgi:hypothetical protein